ncbi:sugar transferase [Deinococcus sonorensis]
MTGTVLIVGANGFVGSVLVRHLLSRRWQVRAGARRSEGIPEGAKFVRLPDLTQPVRDWSGLLEGIDYIVYLAARVHVMNDTHPDPAAAYRAINRDAAVSLAQAAARSGVKRFVYLSSVKVNGESSETPLTESMPTYPIDLYGISKLEAEKELMALGNQTTLEVVILRPPLIYGPGVKANFMALAKAARYGLPLPIGAIHNQRSMIYVENLVDLIATTLKHPAAVGQIFFASDGQDISTPTLTRYLAEAQGVRPWLPAVPVTFLRLAGFLTGRSNIIDRLTGNLQVNSDKAKHLLDWNPPYPVWHALARTGRQLSNPPAPTRIAERLSMNRRQRLYINARSLCERLLALICLVALFPVLLVIALLIKLDSKGPVLFIQERNGRFNRPFQIYKFRTMHVGTPSISTEEMQRRGLSSITRLGSFLRRTSLDELPQLLNILYGEMSFIGPRPALLTQTLVINLRKESGVDQLLPGITGFAQVTGRDNLSDVEKVERDSIYLKNFNPKMDLHILLMTLDSVSKGTGTK